SSAAGEFVNASATNSVRGQLEYAVRSTRGGGSCSGGCGAPICGAVGHPGTSATPVFARPGVQALKSPNDPATDPRWDTVRQSGWTPSKHDRAARPAAKVPGRGATSKMLLTMRLLWPADQPGSRGPVSWAQIPIPFHAKVLFTIYIRCAT